MQGFSDMKRGQREKTSLSAAVREDLLILYILCTKNFHKIIGEWEKSVLHCR